MTAKHGDKTGTQALVEVLLLHRQYPHAHVLAGLEAALSVGALAPEAVAMEVRRAGETDTLRPQLGVVAPGGRIAYPTDTRPLPTVDIYDTLLTQGTPMTTTLYQVGVDLHQQGECEAEYRGAEDEPAVRRRKAAAQHHRDGAAPGQSLGRAASSHARRESVRISFVVIVSVCGRGAIPDLPHDGFLPHAAEVFVGAREMARIQNLGHADKIDRSILHRSVYH